MKVVAVIPARGKSKGVKDKNIAPLMGKPLISYTISDVLLYADFVDKVVVSTDDKKIADVAKKCCVSVIDRPKEYATDEAPIEWALRHAVDCLEENENYIPDIVVWLQANVPIRKRGMIDEVIRKLIDTKADSVITVTEATQRPEYMVSIDGDKIINLPNIKEYRRQDFKNPLYIPDGAVLAMKRDVLMDSAGLKGAYAYLGKDVRCIVQEAKYAIEIDDPLDMEVAKAVLQMDKCENVVSEPSRCARCVLPDTKPNLTFDEDGVCSACRSAELKDSIDWENRFYELCKIISKYKSSDGNNYDCIIPVSGGKDSHFQVITMLDLGVKPLCVTFSPCKSTGIGKRNLENLKNLGVDHIQFTPNPSIYKKLFRLGFERIGDPCLPCHVGIFTYPVQIAVKFNIPLVVWGENSQLEYGGPATDSNHPYLDREWFDKHGGLWRATPDTWIGYDGIDEHELLSYKYPSDEDIRRVGVTGIFLGYFLKWDARSQVKLVRRRGFEVLPDRSIGTYTNYENLDCGFVDIHDYLKYMKFGFGRTTDHASIDIRNNRMTREEGLKLAKKYDGEVERINEFCEFIGISRQEFDEVVHQFSRG